MLLRKLMWAFLAGILFFGCRPAHLKEYDKPYFDFDSLVNVQIRAFSRKDSILKVSILDNQKDTSTFALDSSELAKEWDIFRQLDVINKPLFKNNYQISEEPDTKSNLTVRSYVAKIKSPVPFVRFYYHQDFKNLKRIESQYKEENTLYQSKRNMTLLLNDIAGDYLIYHYTIDGSQKMILSDSVKFSIHGNIVH